MTDAAPRGPKRTYSLLVDTDQAPVGSTSDAEVVDFVDIVEKRPRWFGVVFGSVVVYWIGMCSLFYVALSLVVHDSILNGDWARHEVSCSRGVPVHWKLAGMIYFAFLMALELWVSMQSNIGLVLVQDHKGHVAMALGLGLLARYDAFADITFSMVAAKCGSITGFWTTLIFGFGVLGMQALPALWLLFRQRSSHLALRFNDLLLCLECIDPCRGEFELPANMEALAVGSAAVGSSAPDKVATNGSPLVEPQHDAPKDALAMTDEEIAAVKAEVETLAEFEMQATTDNPDVVKNTALVARAKKVAGAVRFVMEDLLQGVAQVFFLFESWDEVNASTRVFVIGSVIVGVLVSLGGPVHALITERKNAVYYKSLPKPASGTTWKGIYSGTGYVDTYEGRERWYTYWNSNTFKLEEVRKYPGDQTYTVCGEMLQEKVLNEFDGISNHATSEMPEFIQNWIVPENCGKVCDKVEGTYDIKHAAMHLKTISSKRQVLKTGHDHYAHFTFDLKVYPNMIKGEATDPDEPDGPPTLLTLKRIDA